MAITANFTITQGTDNSKITLTDTTNYGGGEGLMKMTPRTIILYKSDGTALGWVHIPSDKKRQLLWWRVTKIMP